MDSVTAGLHASDQHPFFRSPPGFDAMVLSPSAARASVDGNVPSVWLHSLLIPFYVASASAIVFIFQICVTYGLRAYRRAWLVPTPDSDGPFSPGPSTSAGLLAAYNEHVKRAGGSTIFYLKLVRLLDVLGLFGLYLAGYILHKGSHENIVKEHRVIKLALCAAYLYASILSLFTIVATPRFSSTASKHLSIVLSATLLLYTYRDFWPLLTFTLVPADRDEGLLLWSKMTLLAFAAVVIPLAVPRQYTPYDPKDPAPIPNPEQTGSIFSMAIHSYLSSLIWKAYRVPHLGYDQLPPNADYDRAKNLVERAFPRIDEFSGAKRKHFFWALLSVFRWEYVAMLIVAGAPTPHNTSTVKRKVAETTSEAFAQSRVLRQPETQERSST